MRKVIQITSAAIPSDGGSAPAYSTEALCDDGTVWSYYYGKKEWFQLAPIPQPEIADDVVTDLGVRLNFEEWWEEHGQFCRAGGGSYEKTFAFSAWEYSKKSNVVG